MPKQRTSPPSQVVIPTTALVASATRYPGRAARIYVQTKEWQRECYRHFAICGEARYAATFFGHAVSRASLFVQTPSDDGPQRQKTGPASEFLAELFAGRHGQVQMLKSLGLHLTVAGECYLVGRKTKYGEVWEVVSVLEMVVAGDTWQIKQTGGLPNIVLNDEDVVIRIWLPDPSARDEAESPFRSLLTILREIEYLTLHVFAQVRSRLTGAGVWFLPKGMTFPPPPDQDRDDGEPKAVFNEADAFMLTLADMMMKPIDDQSIPSAVVPGVVMVDDDILEKIDQGQLIHFWSDLDANAKELREEAIQRFALGMDLPPEQILGMGSNLGTGGGNSNGVSHWGAWQIEEQTIKLHVEPMLDVIVNSLTVAYLRPLLSEGALEQVYYDLAGLRLRPDRSKEAFELYDRGAISLDALLRENGFSSDDKMEEEEFKRWLTVKIASGSATPEMVSAALALVGVNLGIPAPSPVGMPELPPPPSLLDHPTRPRTPEDRAAALVAACNGLVYRALERAGNRIRQQAVPKVKPQCASWETHLHVRANGSAETALQDAWSCAPQVLDGLADPEKVVPALNRYAVTLLTDQIPHSREVMEDYLSRAGVL